MRTNYPEDYQGPRAGVSSDEEWMAIREYQAFLWLRDETWNYSDFDCWLVTRYIHHQKIGEDRVHKMFKDMQEICKIR